MISSEFRPGNSVKSFDTVPPETTRVLPSAVQLLSDRINIS